MVELDRPCLNEFRLLAALPGGVLGPVDFWAFAWFAAIWAAVAIAVFLRAVKNRGAGPASAPG